MKAAVESIFANNAMALAGAYNPDSHYAGPLNLGMKSGGDVAPCFAQVARPNEQTQAIPAGLVSVVRWSATEDWVFYADGASAATTRRVGMYKFNRQTGVWAWQGFITLVSTGTGNITNRAFKVTYDKYTTGTAACTGTTTVTGTGTLWGGTAGSAQISGGGRIGFGSTDPAQISTWYELAPASAPTDTSITLTSLGPNTGGSVAYVIEELRVVSLVTNATATNGGLWVAKGLRPEIFLTGGTSIALGAATDRVRAHFWLADAATITNDVGGGMAVENRTSNDVHYVYCTEGAATSLVIYKYNIRAPLTLTTGKATNYAAVCPVITGTITVTGNISQNNSACWANGGAGMGPGSGVPSIYVVTASRVIRIATSIITAAATALSDQMTEVPPGSVNTAAATAALTTICYLSDIDRLYVGTTGATAFRSYITNYNTTAAQLDHFIFQDYKYSDQSAADIRFGPVPSNTQSVIMQMAWAGGMAYWTRVGTSSFINQLYAVPIASDWDYATNNSNQGLVVFARVATTGATKLSRCAAIVNKAVYYDTDDGPPAEPFRLYYRTAGITDNTGGWTLVPDGGDLSGVAPGTHIQFAAEWNMIGNTMLPTKVQGIIVTFETDDALPGELRWNAEDTVDATGVVGFYQAAAFGVAPTTLTITYRRVDTDAVVLTQASSGTTNGTFEYWTGSAWAAGLGTNTIGTRRRFTPTAGLPGVAVYAKITNP